MVSVPETLAPDVGDVIDTIGGVVSGGAPFETVTATATEVARLPAASRATAVRLCEPLLAVVVFHETEYGAAVTSAPALRPSSRNCTPTTLTLSEALAVTLIVPATVVPEAGEVTVTIRLPVPSCAWAGCGAIRFQPTIANRTATRAILLSMFT